MVVSSKPVASCHEIWIFAPGGFRAPVDECGLFEQHDAADRMASRLRDWLHLGHRSENLLDNCADEYDRASLMSMHDYLHELGVDPATVRVEVVRRGERPDSDVRAPGEPQVGDGWRIGSVSVTGWRR